MKPFFSFLSLLAVVLILACSTAPEQNGAVSATVTNSPTSKESSIKASEEEPKRKYELKATMQTEPEVTIPAIPNKEKKVEAVRVNDVDKKPESSKPIAVEKKKEAPKVETAVSEPPVVKQKPVDLQNKETTAPTNTTTTTEQVPPPPPKPVLTTVDHGPWNQLLQKYVSTNGKVNYKGFKSDLSALTAYLTSLSENPIKKDWSRGEKMAYWINAYNAYTIKLIVDNYPVKSITDLEGGKPWDKKWIKLGDKTYSLNNIENDILRPQFKEPGIHFAVNCAAKSCPPILNRAWTAKNLNANFKKQAIAFINNTSYNEISPNAVKLSKIFDWYKGDFGDIITYLNTFSKTRINKNASVDYKEYDWRLNE